MNEYVRKSFHIASELQITQARILATTGMNYAPENMITLYNNLVQARNELIERQRQQALDGVYRNTVLDKIARRLSVMWPESSMPTREYFSLIEMVQSIYYNPDMVLPSEQSNTMVFNPPQGPPIEAVIVD